MGIKIGNIDASYFKVGSGDCSIYLGDTKLWPTAPTAYKFQATYSDGTDYKVQCNSSSILTTNEARGHSTPYSAMTTAIIGDCVTTIESSTFYNFPNLESIILSDNLTSIESYTFSRCTKLASIEIPSGVTSIKSNAFSSCSNFTTINIPNGVTSIDNYIFSYCNKLSAVTIPSDVTQIGNSSFSTCGSLTSIDIPSGVTSIGNSAFYYCNSLTSITVNAVTPPTLGTNVFYNTNNCPIYVPCESVDAYKAASGWSGYASRIQAIPGSCKKFQATYSDSTTYDALCDGNGTLTTSNTHPSGYTFESMTTAIVGDCVNTIEDNAFSWSTSLSSITIPNTVTSIGYYAFEMCRFTNITIPNGITSISEGTFSYCKYLSSVTIPDAVTSIGDQAFGNCSKLSAITIPSSITSIGDYAFNTCTSLTSVTVEATTPPTLGTNVFNNTNNCPIYVSAESVNTYKAATNWSSYASRIQAIPTLQWVSYYEADSVPNYGVYGIKFQSSASHEYVEYPSYIQFVDENNNYISIYYDGGDWYLETSSGAEEITFDYETDYATIIFDDYGVGAATIDEMALLSTGMPFDMQLYELN